MCSIIRPPTQSAMCAYARSSSVLKRTFTKAKPVDYFLVLDFEATCDRQYLPVQEIIEFPVLKVNAKTFCVESLFHKYVRPTVNPQLSDFCTKLTGIIQDMVDDEATLPETLVNFHSWMKDEGLVDPIQHSSVFVTCGDWDLKSMLPSQCKHLSVPVPFYFENWINVKKVFAQVARFYPRTLPDMLAHFGLTFEGHLHSGIDDCHNIARILKVLGEQGASFKTTS